MNDQVLFSSERSGTTKSYFLPKYHERPSPIFFRRIRNDQVLFSSERSGTTESYFLPKDQGRPSPIFFRKIRNDQVLLSSERILVFQRATTATTTATAEEFLAKARPVIQRTQGINIPFGKPLTPTYSMCKLGNPQIHNHDNSNPQLCNPQS